MNSDNVLSPDDIMDGKSPVMNHVIIFDDDHYYLGGVIGELLSTAGYTVTIVTPESVVADWTRYTLEQGHIEERMKQAGIAILTRRNVVRVSAGEVVVLNALTDQEEVLSGSIVAITMRLPNDHLYNNLMALGDAVQKAGIKSVRCIGDCYGPSLIASANYEGHRYARELDTEVDIDVVPFKREHHKLELA